MTFRSDQREPPSRAITSLQNESVKFIRSLDMRKIRRDTGLFVAEGASILVTAREHGWKPRIFVHGPGSQDNAITRGLMTWARDAGAECLDVTEPVLAKIASKENPQNVLAVFEQRWSPAPDLGKLANNALWLALDEIRDPGNLGTIIRTVEAAGGSGIILIGNTCDPYSREAVRASMGSIFAVPLLRQDPAQFLKLATGWRGDVIGTHLAATADFRAVVYRHPALLVMGSEGSGMSADIARACTSLVRIPMAGKLDSLNLAVATALVLYEIRRTSLEL